MYERAYGYKYTEQQGKSLAEIAKLMRQDIKQAIAEALLPGKPVKYSVRTETYSGGGSINIEVRDWPEAWQECDGYKPGDRVVSGMGRQLCRDYFCAAMLAITGEERPGTQAHEVLTEDAQAVEMTLKRIREAYNHDGSDSMVDYFDVNYYGHVSFEGRRAAERRAEEAARKAARREAIDSIWDTLRRVVVYGSKGKQTVHDAVEIDGWLKLVCGATLLGSSLTGDGAGRELTCSRCKKRSNRK